MKMVELHNNHVHIRGGRRPCFPMTSWLGCLVGQHGILSPVLQIRKTPFTEEKYLEIKFESFGWRALDHVEILFCSFAKEFCEGYSEDPFRFASSLALLASGPEVVINLQHDILTGYIMIPGRNTTSEILKLQINGYEIIGDKLDYFITPR